MAIEIEHKYLVIDDSYKALSDKQVEIMQGYLIRDPEHTVRIRICGDEGSLTIKGKNNGDTRLEFEYGIPIDDARQMMRMCGDNILIKTRYYVPYAGHIWEVDEFHGRHSGLVISEIELSESSHDYQLPPFIGKEVTGDARFYNSSM